jgi:hypothetical protein
MLDLVQPLAAGRQLLGLAGKTRRDAPGRKGSIAKGYSRGSQLFSGAFFCIAAALSPTAEQSIPPRTLLIGGERRGSGQWLAAEPARAC